MLQDRVGADGSVTQDVVEFTPALRAEVEARVLRMASQGRRVIGFSGAEYSEKQLFEVLEQPEVDFPPRLDDTRAVLLGLVGMQEELRDSASDCLFALTHAGVLPRCLILFLSFLLSCSL